jgi:hypothetical protein
MLTDGRRTKSDDNSSHGLKSRWAKNGQPRHTDNIGHTRHRTTTNKTQKHNTKNVKDE